VEQGVAGGPDDLPAPADDELERAGLGWLMGGFPWAHGRTIITTRAAEWVQQGEDSREVTVCATDLQHCDWCGAGSLAMLKCGKCRLVYYCSIDCQKAARSKNKVACVPKRNMDDVMGLSVGSFPRTRRAAELRARCGSAAPLCRTRCTSLRHTGSLPGMVCPNGLCAKSAARAAITPWR
jgi:hypothetical protein